MASVRLDTWVNRLGKEDIPTFGQTSRRMAEISCDQESSANDLAKIILQDSAMTARVLKIVNSAFYNPSGHYIDTVSYAIVVLGFEKVRSLALTVSMMECPINTGTMKHVKQALACAYHAAIQAQKIAEKLKLDDTENIYIAALLHRLGELMFWCFPFEHSEQLETLDDDPEAYAKVEKELLGFSLKALTDSLILEWHLSPLLHEALTNKTERDQRKACINFAFNIADAAKYNWSGPYMQRQIRSISGLTGMTLEDTKKWIYDNARHAQRGLSELGLNDAKEWITPPSDEEKKPSQNKEPRTKHPQAIKNAKPLPRQKKVIGIFTKQPIEQESRKQKHNRISRQLTNTLNEELDLSHFLITTLESIHCALDCNQSFILLYKGREKELVVKQHLGSSSKILADSAIRLLRRESSALSIALEKKQATWSEKEVLLRIDEDEDFIGNNVMVAPISAMGKHLGFVFSFKTSHGNLNAQDFESFCHFCDHASIAFRIFIQDRT